MMVIDASSLHYCIDTQQGSQTIRPQGLKSILNLNLNLNLKRLTAVRVAPLDTFKNTWEHFQLFWRLKRWTFSIRDLSNQNMYLRQNHDVFFFNPNQNINTAL